MEPRDIAPCQKGLCHILNKGSTYKDKYKVLRDKIDSL